MLLANIYAIAFRKKVYISIDELQADLNQWLHNFNHERTNSGKSCCGKTTYQTFQETKHLAKEKMLDTLFQRTIETQSSQDLTGATPLSFPIPCQTKS